MKQHSRGMSLVSKTLEIIHFLHVLHTACKYRFREDFKNPQCIIVYLGVSNIGDVVCVTPALRALKTKFPSTLVHVIGRGKAKEVLSNHPHVDFYHDEPPSYAERISLIRSLRPNAGISFFPGYPELAALVESGASSIRVLRVRGQSKTTESFKFRILASFVDVTWRVPGEYAPSAYIRLVSDEFQTLEDLTPCLGVTEVDARAVESLLKSRLPKSVKIIGIAPGGGSSYRDWDRDRFAELCAHIINRYDAVIALIGAGRDKDIIEHIMKRVGQSNRIFSFANQSIGELKALMEHLSIVISNDSAPAQFARAFHVSTLVLAGPTDEHEHHRPDSKNRILIAPERGQPQTGSWNWERIDLNLARKQMDGIGVEQVKKEFDDLFKIATM